MNKNPLIHSLLTAGLLAAAALPAATMAQDAAAPTVTIKDKPGLSVRVASDGRFSVPGTTVACPADGPACRVNATAKRRSRVYASTDFRIEPGDTARIKMKLSRAGRSRLAHDGDLVVATDIVAFAGQATTEGDVAFHLLKPRR